MCVGGQATRLFIARSRARAGSTDEGQQLHTVECEIAERGYQVSPTSITDSGYYQIKVASLLLLMCNMLKVRAECAVPRSALFLRADWVH